MTYGWALLVVLIVIMALAYFGMLNPNRYLPEKCELDTPGLSCVHYRANNTNLAIYITNNLGTPVYGFTLNATLIRNGSTSSKSTYNVNYTYYTLYSNKRITKTGKGKVSVEQTTGRITGAVVNSVSTMSCGAGKTLPINKAQEFLCTYNGLAGAVIPCSPACQNSGTCNTGTGTCVCVGGYTGSYCQTGP